MGRGGGGGRSLRAGTDLYRVAPLVRSQLRAIARSATGAAAVARITAVERQVDAYERANPGAVLGRTRRTIARARLVARGRRRA